MANYVPNMDAKDVGLWINDPGLKLVICLRDMAFNGSAETIDISTKCGDAEAAGKLTNQVTFSGYAVKNGAGAVISFNELITKYLNKVLASWVMKDTDTPTPTYYRAFNGQLTSYNETANYNDYVAIEGTISIQGDVDTTP
jgi:hypothetical protein